MARRLKTAPLTARREAALSAVPRHAPVVRQETKGEKLLVTVKLRRARWQCFLGADEMLERTFGLDKYGRQVYEACDGERSVKQIVRLFSKQTRVSEPEAETAVTKFLHTLLCKGLIMIQMEKPTS